MPQELTVALKTAKDIEKQLTVAENRLAYVQDETKRLIATRDKQQAEIDEKTANYNIFISQRDTDSKRMRQEIQDQHVQLEKDKAEFQGILQQFQQSKKALQVERDAFENDKRKTGAQTNSIREFIIAVQRASSLLNL